MTEEQKQKARERSKKYYQKNKAKILARQKEYCKRRYHEDEEYRKKVLERGKNYRESNIEKFRQIRNRSQKKHYAEHRDYYREYNKNWYQNHISSYKGKKIQITNLQEELDRVIKEKEELVTYACDLEDKICYLRHIIKELEEYLIANLKDLEFNCYFKMVLMKLKELKEEANEN